MAAGAEPVGSVWHRKDEFPPIFTRQGFKNELNRVIIRSSLRLQLRTQVHGLDFGDDLNGAHCRR